MQTESLKEYEEGNEGKRGGKESRERQGKIIRLKGIKIKEEKKKRTCVGRECNEAHTNTHDVLSTH